MKHVKTRPAGGMLEGSGIVVHTLKDGDTKYEIVDFRDRINIDVTDGIHFIDAKYSLKVCKTGKGRYFMYYGKRVYLPESEV